MMPSRLVLCLAIAAASLVAKDFQRSAPLASGGRVSVDNYKGLIRVTTWDQQTVDVQAHIEADGTSQRDQELVDSTEIEFYAGANSVDIRTRYPKHHYDNVSQPLVQYTIRIPRNAELRVKDYKSEIDVDGVGSRLDLETYKGDINVRRHAGELRVKNYKSESRIDFAAYTGTSSFETYKGTYNITMPRDARFDIHSDFGRRANLSSSFPVMLPAGSSTDGRVSRASVNGGGPAMYLKGYRGEFNLR